MSLPLLSIVIPAYREERNIGYIYSLLPYINYGVSLGWVNTQNMKFRPNDIISQGEIDKLIAVIK